MVSCNHKPSTVVPASINIEMFGSWGNDKGCMATFTKINNRLFLTKFIDEKNNTLNNIILDSKKVSIMTSFKAQNSKINFNGSFLEGVIIINTYCTQPLHKIDN
jgi:hypothetical protein